MLKITGYYARTLEERLIALRENFEKDTERERGIRVCENEYAVQMPLDISVLKDLGRIPGLNPIKRDKYTIPFAFDSALHLLLFAEKNDFWFERTAGQKLQEILGFKIEGMTSELLPFQKIGVRYALEKKSVLIADEMGLGKGVQALAVIQSLKDKKALIVVPASLRSHWVNEIHELLPSKSVQVVKGATPLALESTDIVIISYRDLATWLVELKRIPFEIVVFDESHFLKNEYSRRSQAALDVSRSLEYRILLSATPIENRTLDLFNQLQIMGKSNIFGDKVDFKNRYCDRHKEWNGPKWRWVCDGASNIEELNKKLTENCLIRRIKTDVLPDLPKKTITPILIELTNKLECEIARKNVLQPLEERLLAFTKIVDSQKEIESIDEATSIQNTLDKAMRAIPLFRKTVLRQLTAEGKVDEIINWANPYKYGNEKVVIFFHLNKIGEQISKSLEAPIIRGGISLSQRNSIIRDFNENDNIPILVMNIDSAGSGIDLSTASLVAFAEMDWSPAKMARAVDLCHQPTSKSPVQVFYFIGENSIDVQIYDVQNKKRSIINQVLDGDNVPQTDEKCKNIQWLLEKVKS